jgi:type VI protein secretion system component VasF
VDSAAWTAPAKGDRPVEARAPAWVKAACALIVAVVTLVLLAHATGHGLGRH